MAGQIWNNYRRYWRESLAAFLFLSALVVGLIVYFKDMLTIRSELSITGGSASGLRSQLARRLQAEARKQGLSLQLQETGGSKRLWNRSSGDRSTWRLFKAASKRRLILMFARLPRFTSNRFTWWSNPVYTEPVSENLANLRGKTVNVNSPASGTHDLAIDVLEFAGLRPRHRALPGTAAGTSYSEGDYEVSMASYSELEAQVDRGELPDAVFTVSDLPSPIVRHLVAKRRYQLVPLPFGEAFSLDSFEDRSRDPSQSADAGKRTMCEVPHLPDLIPAFTYGVEPPSPPEPLAHLRPAAAAGGPRVDPPQAVRAGSSRRSSRESFAQYYRPPLDPSLLDLAPEYPWHPGTDEYREYHKPILAGDVVDLLEKATSLAGAIAGALFFLWQWLRQYYRRKRELGFESYMLKVAAIEQTGPRPGTRRDPRPQGAARPPGRV